MAPGAKPVIWNIVVARCSIRATSSSTSTRPIRPMRRARAIMQANVHAIPLLESRNWRMDLDELARRVSSKTKVVVINSPHNPTGGVLTTSDLELIAELAQRHDFLVLADEIYSRNFYLGTEYVSIASLAGDARAHDRRRRFFEGLRDDRLATRIRDHARAPCKDGDALQQQHVQLRRDLRADGRNRRADRNRRARAAHERDLPRRAATAS